MLMVVHIPAPGVVEGVMHAHGGAYPSTWGSWAVT